MPSKDQAVQSLLTRNVEEVIEREHLAAALKGGKKLRVKFGIDPTGSNIHIGRAVVLWKLREFQDLGHKIVLIIGDYTALIGDPSDKLEKRPMLTPKEVKANLKTYLAQIGLILDMKKVEVRYNSEWLGGLNFQEISELANIFTVQQMIERENFKVRWEGHKPISLRETMYPLMQGYDSVAVKADVELGGTDQLFNLLAGRKIQEHYGQKPQDVLMTSMLLGTDGRKMSTSWGNVINIADVADEQYGKVMALHDDLIVEYFKRATNVDEAEWKNEKKLKGENPKFAKQRLAFEIVQLYHGQTAAEKAADKWEKLFSKKDTRVDMPEVDVPDQLKLVELVVLCFKSIGIEKSKSEATRLIEQGAVRIDSEVWKDIRAVIKPQTEVIKIGRHYFRLTPDWSK